MLEVKAGQWWTDKESVAARHRIFVLGVTRTFNVVVEYHDGSSNNLPMEYFLKYKEHLPECTGWDWEPVAYPQYRESYMPNVWAFVRLDSPTQYTNVRLDGKEDPKQEHHPSWDHVNKRTRLTEAEALAKIVKTRTVKVHTVAYGYDKLKFVSNVLDSELDGVKRDWKYIQILKTEEYEVPCE